MQICKHQYVLQRERESPVATPFVSGSVRRYTAAIAVGYGLSEDDVYRAVTINAAEILSVSDRVGSLEVGKDADVIVLNGDPLSITTWVDVVFVNGVLVYERQ